LIGPWSGIMKTFNKLVQIFNELGFEDEADLTKQFAPSINKVASWTGDDCSAIILGIGEKEWVDFVFDENMKLREIRTDNAGCRYTEPV
jgi:hypothetical protein